MTFSKTTEYALRVLALMAGEEKKLHSSLELYKELKIPKKYLQRLLTDLSKSGLIKSIQGRSGGFLLARKADKIRISEIIDAVEGFRKEPGCFFGFDTCALDNPCSMHDIWTRSQKDLINILNKTHLSDLINKSKAN